MQPRNQFFLTSTVANGRPLHLWKVSLGFDELLMSYYLFTFSCPAHDVTNFIDFDWFRQLFGHFLIWNYSPLYLYSSGTRRDIKKRYTAIFLIFAAFSNLAIKNISLHFNGTWLYQSASQKTIVYNCVNPDMFKLKILLLTASNRFLTWEALKSGTLLFQNPTFDGRCLSVWMGWAKINTSLHCSKFATVDHVVYSLWTGWCLFK